MRTSFFDIDSSQQRNSAFSAVRKTHGGNFSNFNSSNLNTISLSNPEQRLTQIRLEEIESELAKTCSLYRQRCQEFDAITVKNKHGYGLELNVELDQTCEEILTLIHRFCQLKIEENNLEIKSIQTRFNH